jgi:hypothetical protein
MAVRSLQRYGSDYIGRDALGWLQRSGGQLTAL